MTSIARRLPHTISRREFLTPFDGFLNEIFSNSFPSFHNELGPDFFSQGSYPKCNVLNLDDRVEIEAAIPGLLKEDVDVEIKDGILTIRAESNQRSDVEDSHYVRREVKRSAFARSFKIGEDLDDSGITGQCENGVLTLTIPKLKPNTITHETRKIEIQ